MRFYTTEVLSARQQLTPEGYLLCKDVPIARTGTQLYAAGEVPVTAVDGLIRIERLAEDVFAENTIASFAGKPVTLDHPAVDVNPANWSQLAKGIVQNVRPGAGVDSDYLLADLLLTDAATIREVRDGLREVSCGYDADYQEIQPGRGRQANILGNHVALVEKGRCGSRCAIGDSMQKRKFIDRLRAAFKARDEAEFESTLSDNPTMDEAETEEEKKKREAKEAEEAEEKKKTSDALAKVADSVKALDARLAKLETRDAEEDETEEEKKKRAEKEKKEKEEEDGKTGDSAALAELVQDVLARAEILSPGLSLPTYDRQAAPRATRDAMCALRLKAVQSAFEAGKYRDAITPFLGKNPDFRALTCDAVASAFIGASEIVRRENNAGARNTYDGSQAAAGVALSISAINKRNAEFWKRG